MDLEFQKVEIAEIDSTKAYIVSVEVGDSPLQEVEVLCKAIKRKLEEMGFKQFVIMPCKEGVPSIKFTEIKDHPDLCSFSNDVEINVE